MVTTDASPIVATFIGGPRDGEERQLPDLRGRWLFPVRELGRFELATEANICDTHPVLVYDLALDRDAAGRYRYQFRGER